MKTLMNKVSLKITLITIFSLFFLALLSTDSFAQLGWSGISTRELNDVDADTAPADGEALLWDDTEELYVPGAAGVGDVESVGDCTDGACLDGTSDGGTEIAIYDGDSNKTTISMGNASGDLLFILPPDDGDNLEVLHTDGSGVLSWSTDDSAGSTAWDDIGNPDAADEIDFGSHITELNVEDFRIGDGGSAYVGFNGSGAMTINNTAVPGISISLTNITGIANQAIDIIGGEALGASESFTGIRIKPSDLDPTAGDVKIRGLAVNLSEISTVQGFESIDAIRLVMPVYWTDAHAIHITEGQVFHACTIGSDAGATYVPYSAVVDASSLHANSAVHVVDVATSGGVPSGTIYGLGTHTYIAPIGQHIGTYSIPSQTEYAGEKTGGGANWVDGVDASEIFVVNADEIYVGSATTFSEIEVIFGTAGTKTVSPTFHYNTAADVWTQFYPEDDTDGFQQSGLIHWSLGDISGTWTNNGDPGGAETSAGYWIKIIRTAAPDPGTPTPTTAKIGTVTVYSWNKDGDVDVLSMEADTITEGGNAVYSSGETPSGELGGTYANITIDDNVTVTGWVLGTSSATQLTSPTIITDLIDTTGAADIDIGSADVTDVTIITDGGTLIIDNGITSVGEDIGSATAEWNDLFLNDGGIIKMGNDQDVTITHVADTGILVNLEVEIDGTLDADGIVALGDGGDNFSVASDGIDIDTSGNITNAGTIASGAVTATGVINTSVGLDAVGAVDMDYGSVDVTDHTFTTDGTGDAEIVLPNDSIGPAEIDSTTGAYDFGGVTSFEIPNTAGDITIDAAGEIAVDSTQKQLVVYDGIEKVIPLRHIIQGQLGTGDFDSDPDVFMLSLHADTYPDGIVLTGWDVSCSEADPTTELAGDLKYCDDRGTGAFPGANAVLVDVLDTTTGNSSEATMSNSDLGSGVIPTGKELYILLDSDLVSDTTLFRVMVKFYIPED